MNTINTDSSQLRRCRGEESNMEGRVKSFTPRHYGFITKDGKDYLFSYKDWTLRLPPVKGFWVEFDPEYTEKGLKATNIRKKS
jgi:cold shock CspA family protein